MRRPLPSLLYTSRIIATGVIGLVLISSLAPASVAQTTKKSVDSDPLPITIEASEFLEWDQNNGTYVAKGNAYVEQGSANIAANHIIANYETGGESRDITRVIATGAVTYVEGENTAKGDKLDYDLNSSLYVLTGKKASVVGPRGAMTATQSITYDATDEDNRKVTAIGKAQYKNSDGRSIFGDKLIAYIGADGSLKTIDAFDNTKVITTEGTTATADKLNYVASTSLANLVGNVEINDKTNIMRGDRAEIDFDKEISKILSSPTGKRVTGILTP
ncbi:MAG: hypothetical protein O2835_09650 [Proteobacteria bacterium]|nr:hypothetical protein [Pseudomonadota bacterium]MDA0961152.1 hypothetical protein [Pseudomonadota bacterium]MDA1153079.1 hypothetical protein [Pseudomonadota bacterium]